MPVASLAVGQIRELYIASRTSGQLDEGVLLDLTRRTWALLDDAHCIDRQVAVILAMSMETLARRIDDQPLRAGLSRELFDIFDQTIMSAVDALNDNPPQGTKSDTPAMLATAMINARSVLAN